MKRRRRRIRVTGTVQGVGFRPFVHRLAVELDLGGWVANDAAGVLIEAEGAPSAVEVLCARLLADAPPLAVVVDVRAEDVPAVGERTFSIAASADAGAARTPVSVDVGPCAACLGEVADPADRRHRYPFTTCTDCGPRYTITRRLPYDRPQTTMAAFRMCAACQAEYDDPSDRRFHAQPNACPDCGPRLVLTDRWGGPQRTGDEALTAAVDALRGGRIVALKGVGGFHLACDATDAAVVAELRRRKSRDDKPFALLVADLDAARALVALDPAAEAALADLRRPIVLAPRRPDAGVAAQVAPGLAELGVMLPPSPLHHLLAADVGRPLVLTSGNRSDEPIAHTDDDAFERLSGLVDAFLTHDRPIHIRCDDSVVRAAGSRLQAVRRSRGYAPRPFALPGAPGGHVLALGAELKSTVAVAADGQVVASHHLGDLEHYATYTAFLQAVEHLQHLYRISPQVVAHDLHPEYLSTKLAGELDLPLHGVQHHHAHIASCLVEHGRRGPVLGVAFDGLGYGTDGTLWGGELLVADLDGFTRVGHLRGVGMPGGAAAVREPWRMAVAWVDAALDEVALARLGPALDDRWGAVAGLARSAATPRTTSAGRLFDAVAALLGLRRTATYEGQAAIALETAARRAGPEPPTLPFGIDRTGPLPVIDARPLIAAVVAARADGADVDRLAAGFHLGLARVTAELAGELAAEHDLDTVALSGGVFQNVVLTDLLAARLRATGLQVLLHRDIPANDGGISIGQAAVAARATATSET